MKTISIIQPHFIPWIGFFEIINKSDIFVFLDNVKYPHGRSFINRNNLLRSDNQKLWITIPIKSKQKNLLIKHIKISKDFNKIKLLNNFRSIISNNKYFDEANLLFEKILSRNFDNLSDLNIYSTKLICNYLNIKTKFYQSSKLQTEGKKNELLISIMKNFDEISTYISGEGGQSYLDQKLFLNSGYELKMINYNFLIHSEFLDNYKCSILQLISLYGSKIKSMFNSELQNPKLLVNGKN